MKKYMSEKEKKAAKKEVRKILSMFGTHAKAAKKIGTSIQTVNNWLSTGLVSSHYVIKVEKASKGLINRTKLRPDIYPEKDYSIVYDKESITDHLAKELADSFIRGEFEVIMAKTIEIAKDDFKRNTNKEKIY